MVDTIEGDSNGQDNHTLGKIMITIAIVAAILAIGYYYYRKIKYPLGDTTKFNANPQGNPIDVGGGTASASG